MGTAPHLTPPSTVRPWQGHAAPILYAVWAEAGFLPEAELLNLRKISSDLDGHPVPVRAPHQASVSTSCCPRHLGRRVLRSGGCWKVEKGAGMRK